MHFRKISFAWRAEKHKQGCSHSDQQLPKELEKGTLTVISATEKKCQWLTNSRIPQHESSKSYNPQLSKRPTTLKFSGEGTDHSLRGH